MNTINVVCTSCKAANNGNGFNIILKAFTNRTTKDAFGETTESFVLTYYLWRSQPVPVIENYDEKELMAALKSGDNSKFVELDLDDYHMEEKIWVVPEGQPNAGEERKLKHIVLNDVWERSTAKRKAEQDKVEA